MSFWARSWHPSWAYKRETRSHWSRPADKIPAYVTLDARLFAETYRKLGGTGQVLLPAVGGGYTITFNGTSTP